MRHLFVLLFILLIFTCSDSNPTENFNNSAPQIIHLIALPDSVEFNASVLVFCSAYDADNQKLSYHWNSNCGTILGVDSVITWVAPDFVCSPWIYCSVSDTYGAEDMDSLQVFVFE